MSTATRAQKDHYENSRPWRWLSKTVIANNPICQAIEPESGEQCHNPASIVHHLVAPEDCWELRNVVSNLCAVCPAHHAGGARGDNARLNYVPTRECVGFGQPEVLHHHKTVAERANPQSDIAPHELAAIAAKEAQARAEWLAWKARQSKATALESGNPNIEPTPTPPTP